MCRILALIIGAVHASAAAVSESMNTDGIAYLDMGQAWLRGDMQMAINAYWSPFYSWLLGLALAWVPPRPTLEPIVVHAVNFIVFVAALLCFEFFWRYVVLWNRRNEEPGWLALPEWGQWLLGYALFVWSATQWIQVWSVTPDMCVAAWVYLAAGLLLRMRLGSASIGVCAAFGLVLGLAYLSKAAMFPLSAVFLGVAALSGGGLRRSAIRLVVAVAAFLLVAGPFVAALSLSVGRPTFGEAGRLNYLWYINGVPRPHWQGDGSDSGTPSHPTRVLLQAPPVYEFDGPIAGTYPPWYDPTYWYAGTTPHFDARGQLAVLGSQALRCYDLFFLSPQAGLIAVLLLLLLGAGALRNTRTAARASWFLVLPALAAFAMYSLVLVEKRYLGAFVVVLWAGLISGLRLPDDARSRRLSNVGAACMTAFLVLSVVVAHLEGWRDLRRGDVAETGTPAHVAEGSRQPSQVALGLLSVGLRTGDKVGFIGYGYDAYWARLARLRIIAELYPWQAEGLWLPGGDVHARVIEAFAKTEARAVVAESIPTDHVPPGWRRVGDTRYFVFSLAEP